MSTGRRLVRVMVVAVVATGGIVVGAAPDAVALTCSTSPTRTLSGTQGSAFTSTLAAGERVDATTATWTGTTSYPAYFDSTADSCWTGGSFKGTWSPTTTWNTYHGTAGMGISGARFTLDRPRIFNYGDGIRIRDNTDGFLVRDAYLAYIHDDCIENDRLVSITVQNTFLDGCYVGFSARQSSGDNLDGSANTVTINNTLVRLQAMPKVYSGSAAGHGGFFKWDTSGPTGPKLAITNSVFRADQDTNHQDLNLPAGYPYTCSNNVMVWLGDGPFPGSLPSCFTVTTDRSVWDAAVASWDAAHPGVLTGPEVSVGDGSILEGTSGGRSLRVPISLQSKPGSKPVTVYWATAPGTAGSGDFKAKRGKLVFKDKQVFKTVTVPITVDSKDEADESLAIVVAGVDGGRNHRERGRGTIVDDDPGSGVRLAVSDGLVVEGDNGTRKLIVTFALSNPATADVVIKYSTQNGTAVAGNDYTAKVNKTLKIPASKRFKTVAIPILSGTTPEGTESFNLVVTSATNATIVDGVGTYTILDDD